MTILLKKPIRKFGYDAGFVMDDFKCVKSPCECANYKNKIFGDMILSLNSAKRLIKSSSSKQNDIHKAYGNQLDDQLWTNHKIGGKYIISYKINRGLDPLTKRLIPQVCSQIENIT